MNSRKIVTIDPGRSSHPVNTRVRQVPISLTPLIGREHEMQTVSTLLLQPEVRLLTLTGTGGVGKTRLALQIAAVLQGDFADGVCFISLASIDNPDLVVPIIAHTLELIETGERVLFERLKTFLQDKHLLLLLDNFEQVLMAAPALANLLSACPGVKLLVTSRAVLHVQGEYEYSVPLLALPDLHCLPDWETISQYAAVRLFVQRAQAIKTGFQVTESNARAIAEICARLDGLPLALELAAARIKLLSPQTLLARLEHRLEVLTRGGLDLPARQQTLHNTITWGYDLLTGEEQRCFRRLSIFDGGCTLEAAERVCNAPGDLATPILDLVASLLDKSLLQQVEQGGDEPRLLLLETTREYGLERLLETGELERFQEVHAEYYLALIEEATPALYGMHERTCLERLDQERNNLLAALHFLFERNAPEALLWFAGSLGQFWLLQGSLNEGQNELSRVLSGCLKCHTTTSLTLKAKVLYAAGKLALLCNQEERAVMALEASLRLFLYVGFNRGIAAALNSLGYIKHNRGDVEATREMHQEALSLYRAAEDRAGVADVLQTLGREAFFRGEFVQARTLCEQSLVLHKELGVQGGIAFNLHVLGWASYCQGDYARARIFTEECLALLRTLGWSGYLVETLNVLACELVVLGDEVAALALLEEALSLGRVQDNQDYIAQALCGMGRLALRKGDLARARTLFEESIMVLKELWTSSSPAVKWTLASALEGLGEIALSQEQAAWTVQLFAAADAVRTVNGYSMRIGKEQPSYKRILTSAHAQLDRKTFDALWERGQRMCPQQALSARHLGEAIVPTSLLTSTIAPAPAPSSGLTRRELEVLGLLANGLTNKQIADQLVVSEHTVNVHVQSIYSKLGVTSRVAATRYAISHGLL